MAPGANKLMFKYRGNLRKQYQTASVLTPERELLSKQVFKLFSLKIFSIWHRCHLSVTPVMHLELQISPQIFEKFLNGSNGILRGLGGKMIHEKS